MYNESLEEQLERIRETQFQEDDRKREEIHRWKLMPAHETENRIASIRESFKNKKLTIQHTIMLRVIIPASYDFKFSWSCFLEILCNGETISQEYASADYCESIFDDKSWEEETHGDLSFFSQKLEHIIVEKKTRKKKQVG